MTLSTIFQRFWCRRDTAANWTSVNPVLASGEWGVETDNTGATPRRYKMGDGVTAWTSLPYSDATGKMDKSGGTFTGDIIVPDEAYDATAWNGSLEVPTKNAVRDKIESLSPGSSGSGQTLSNCLWVNDTKGTGTPGGASSAGVNTRVLNTIVANNISGASLASNQITLPAGTYRISASAPNQRGGRTRLYLYNVTDAATALLGPAGYQSTTNGAGVDHLDGYLTIAGTKDFALRQYVQSALATNGLGVDTSDGQSEIYAQLFAWKL